MATSSAPPDIWATAMGEKAGLPVINRYRQNRPNALERPVKHEGPASISQCQAVELGREMRRMSRCQTFRWLLLAFALGTPGVAIANAGIPMIALTLPFMAIALVPIIALELIGLRWQLGVPGMKAAQVSTVANVTSTLVGIPLAWLCYLTLGYIVGIPMGALGLPGGLVAEVTLFAAWLPPNESNLGWMIPAATAVLLIGYFFVSVWLERNVARRMLPELTPAKVDKAVRNVNLFSYALLELLALGALAYALLV